MARPCRLPVPPTPFIGRARERAAAAAQLRRAEVRLLTLTGAGGVGKTRLALSVVADVLDGFEDGAFFVDLAPVLDPALVPSAIARALEVNETAHRPLTASLVEHLRGRSLLLVLDNMEHVLSAAPVVAGLLGASPNLKVLVTSRAALRLSGEHELPVPPLELPDPTRLPDVAALHGYEAVTLFVQRACAARPDFEITTANAPAVAELCARLDGLPLAIELAAARIKLLSPQVLLARLGSRLSVLTGGARDLPPRQQALRSTMDWSYDLLEPAERVLFARLAVFIGGCSLDAIEAVCDGGASDEGRGMRGEGRVKMAGPSPLDVVASLVDKSLLRQADGSEGEARFTMLETIREYAAERFAASDDAEMVLRRHAEYFLALAEQAAPALTGPEQAAWLERLERDHANLRAAFGWALEWDNSDVGLRLAAALGRFWEVRSNLSEGRGWLERALSRWPTASTPARAETLNAAGNLANRRGEHAEATAHHAASLELRRALGDCQGVATSLHNLGVVAIHRGDLEQAAALHAESLAIWRALDDRWGMAISINGAGVLARNRGDYDGARALYQESLAIFRELGDTRNIALLLNNLARVERDQGSWERATALCAESLSLNQELGDRQGSSWVLSNLVVIGQRRGAWEWAARVHGAVEALCEAVGSIELSISPAERVAYDAAVESIRTSLGAEAFRAATAAGREVSPEEILGAAPWASATGAVGERLAPAPLAAAPPGAQRAPSPLTRRERDVATLVARGLTDRQIAEELVITEGTVGVHLNNIFTKLDLHARAQLAVWAAEHGLLRNDPERGHPGLPGRA